MTQTRFRQGAAFSKAHALLLAREKPVDLRSGRPIDTGKALSWSNDKEYHHFFPQAHLKRQGYSDSAINAVGNIIMLTSITNIHVSDQRPSEYLMDLVDMHGEEQVRHFCEHSLVPSAAFDAALANDFDAFLQIRAAYLHSRVVRGPNGRSTTSCHLKKDELSGIAALVASQVRDEAPEGELPALSIRSTSAGIANAGKSTSPQ